MHNLVKAYWGQRITCHRSGLGAGYGATEEEVVRPSRQVVRVKSRREDDSPSPEDTTPVHARPWVGASFFRGRRVRRSMFCTFLPSDLSIVIIIAVTLSPERLLFAGNCRRIRRKLGCCCFGCFVVVGWSWTSPSSSSSSCQDLDHQVFFSVFDRLANRTVSFSPSRLNFYTRSVPSTPSQITLIARYPREGGASQSCQDAHICPFCSSGVPIARYELHSVHLIRLLSRSTLYPTSCHPCCNSWWKLYFPTGNTTNSTSERRVLLWTYYTSSCTWTADSPGLPRIHSNMSVYDSW